MSLAMLRGYTLGAALDGLRDTSFDALLLEARLSPLQLRAAVPTDGHLQFGIKGSFALKDVRLLTTAALYWSICFCLHMKGLR